MIEIKVCAVKERFSEKLNLTKWSFFVNKYIPIYYFKQYFQVKFNFSVSCLENNLKKLFYINIIKTFLLLFQVTNHYLVKANYFLFY